MFSAGHDVAGATVTDVESIDPATGVVRRAGSLALPTHGSAAANLAGRILVFGGASTSVYNTVQQFFPATGRTQIVGHMPGVRADVTAAVVGGRAILVGGFDGIGPQSAVWQTRTAATSPSSPTCPKPVRYAAVAALGNVVYVFGGLISGGEYTGTFSDAIQRIDLSSGAASVVGRLPTPLAHAMAATVNGAVYVLAARHRAGRSNAIERLDPKRNRMQPAGRLPHPLTDAAVATIGPIVYLLGGISTAPVATITVIHPH